MVYFGSALTHFGSAIRGHSDLKSGKDAKYVSHTVQSILSSIRNPGREALISKSILIFKHVNA